MRYILIIFSLFSTLLYGVSVDELEKFGNVEKLREKLDNMKKGESVSGRLEPIPVKNSIVTVPTDATPLSLKAETMKKSIFNYRTDEALVKEREESHISLPASELHRYGDSFFRNRNVKNANSLPIPNWYKINIGDVVSIWLYGGRDKNDRLEVDRNGNINIEGVGPTYVYNMEFSQFKQLLENKYKTLYKNGRVHIDLIRTTPIQITIAGEVASAGIYNIPAFSTIKEALLEAGGVSKVGSYRDIKLIRNGKTIKTFDIYKLIRKGDTSYLNYNLQTEDTVLVKKSNKNVTISGEVIKPAIYQLKRGENLSKLLEFAGGLSVAGSNKAKLSRLEEHKKRVVKDIDPMKNIELMDGDMIRIYPVNRANSDSIYIYGNVAHTGERGFIKGLTLYDFFNREIQLNGIENVFLKNIDMEYSVIRRYNFLTYSDEILHFSLEDVLSGKENIPLKKGDEIYIFNRAELKENPYIYIRGKVITTPGKYQYFDNMNIGDITSFVKFKTEDFIDGERRVLKVSKEIKLLRNIRDKLEIHFLDVDKNRSFKIEPLDEIIFYDKLEREKPRFASVKGEVLSPGNFRIDTTTDINKLIQLAQGLTKEAYLDRFEVIRYRIENGERRYEVLEMSLSEAIENSFLIEEFDEVTIFKIPNWNDRESVSIRGEVRFPGVYTIQKDDTLRDLLERAGGTLDGAFLRGAVFTRESIKGIQKRRLEESIRRLKQDSVYLLASPASMGEKSEDRSFLLKMIDSLVAELRDFKPNGRVSVDISKGNFLLENGDNLYIPTKNETVTVIGEVLNPNTFFYKEGEDVEYYLDRSGGLNMKADLENIYIVHPNGEAERYETGFLFGFGSDVETGDTIIIPMKVETSSFTNITKDVTQILYQMAITAVSLKTVGVL
jgi:polysaccharide export outer membrane protein